MNNRIEAKRLILRPWTASDATELISIAGQPHILARLPDWADGSKWIPGWIKRVQSHDEIDDPTRAFISYAITEKDTGAVIGQINAGTDDFDGQLIGIGYFIGAGHQGMGYTTEALLHWSQALFDHYGYDSVNLLILEDNAASLRVAEKAGFYTVASIIKQLDGHPHPEKFIHLQKTPGQMIA